VFKRGGSGVGSPIRRLGRETPRSSPGKRPRRNGQRPASDESGMSQRRARVDGRRRDRPTSRRRLLTAMRGMSSHIGSATTSPRQSASKSACAQRQRWRNLTEALPAGLVGDADGSCDISVLSGQSNGVRKQTFSAGAG